MNETHEFKFTGIFLPKHILQLFDTGDLSCREVMLVAMVEGLAGEEGCYASNTYLGERLGVDGQYASRLINRLVEKEILKVWNDAGGKRRIITGFQHLEQMSEGPTGVGGGSDRRGTLAPSKEGVYRKGYISGRSPEGFGVSGKSWCEQAAQVFIRELSTRRLLMRQPSIKAWAGEFQAILGQGVPKKELKETILWYLQMLHAPYMPQAYSARTFRDKYPTIRRRFLKEQKEGVGLVSPKDLTPQEMRVYEVLQHFCWPKGSKDQVPGVLRQSIANYKAFLAKAEATTLPANLREFHRWMQAAHFGQVGSTMERYFYHLFERLVGWESWGGDLTPYIWAPDIKHVLTYGKQCATDFANDPGLYTRYLEAVGYAR